jgi:hypothetical protein
VPRKTKTTQNQNDCAGESNATGPAHEAKLGKGAARRTSTAAKKSKPPGKKREATRTIGPRTGAKVAQASVPTDKEIQLRAYFISERRHRFALPGDASSDWLEAKRQLLSESGRR